MLGRGGRDGQQAAFVIMLWVGQAGLYLFHDVDISITSALGGRGSNKALGRVLLEKNVDRQSCLREAVNSQFSVKSPYSECN